MSKRLNFCHDAEEDLLEMKRFVENYDNLLKEINKFEVTIAEKEKTLAKNVREYRVCYRSYEKILMSGPPIFNPNQDTVNGFRYDHNEIDGECKFQHDIMDQLIDIDNAREALSVLKAHMEAIKLKI
jgi:hypothetical protein